MIAAENLRKNYGDLSVLRDLSFTARAGEITLLVGPNGAGKTTTLRILAGLARPDGGSAQIGPHDVASERVQAQRALCYLPQRPNFHPRLTCVDLLRFYARLRGIAFSRIDGVIERMGLNEFAHLRCGTLSGGTRQRLGLALLFLAQAPALLLDEPGLSLDPGWRKRLQEFLRAEAASGKAVLVTTHLIAEWNGVTDRCLLCHEGKITRELDPEDLPHDFDDVGSAGASGAGDDASSSRSLCSVSSHRISAGAPRSVRGTRALPGVRG